MPMTALSKERGQEPGSGKQGNDSPHENCYGFFGLGEEQKSRSGTPQMLG